MAGLLIFCSSDPSMWDTSTKESKTRLAVPLSTVPDDIHYLRMRASGVNAPVIISLSKDRLGKDTRDGRYGWSGDKNLQCGWLHIGIYDSNINVRHHHDRNLKPNTFGRIYVDHVRSGPDGCGGWGFGSIWGRENEKKQEWSWAGYEVGKTDIEIAVTSAKLTKKEGAFLLH